MSLVTTPSSARRRAPGRRRDQRALAGPDGAGDARAAALERVRVVRHGTTSWSVGVVLGQPRSAGSRSPGSVGGSVSGATSSTSRSMSAQRRPPAVGVGRVEREQLERGDAARSARRRTRPPRTRSRRPAVAAAMAPSTTGAAARHRRRPAAQRPPGPAAEPAAEARGPASREVRASPRWGCAPPTVVHRRSTLGAGAGAGSATTAVAASTRVMVASRARRYAGTSVVESPAGRGLEAGGLGVAGGREPRVGEQQGDRARSSEHRVELGQGQLGGGAGSTRSPSIVIANVSGSMSMSGSASLFIMSALPIVTRRRDRSEPPTQAERRRSPSVRAPPATRT